MSSMRYMWTIVKWAYFITIKSVWLIEGVDVHFQRWNIFQMDRRGNLLRLYNNDFSIKLIALPLGTNSTHTIQNNERNCLKLSIKHFLLELLYLITLILFTLKKNKINAQKIYLGKHKYFMLYLTNFNFWPPSFV